MDEFEVFKGSILSEIIYPLLGFVFALAVLYFLWGVAKYIMNYADPAARKTGQQHMIWGIVGLGIMLSVYGIILLIYNTVRINNGVGGVGNEPPKTIQNIQGGRGL